jgi:uncharacterized membrane protein YbhN (UPF0104 family)
VRTLWDGATAAAAQVAHARGSFLAAAFAIFLTSFVIVGFRWRLILRALGCRATLWDTTLTYAAGVCVSNITTARTLGADAFRLAVIRSKTAASVRHAAASIVYDRLSEAPAIAVLALLTLSRFHAYRWTAVALVAAIAGLALAGPVRRAIASRIAAWHETLVGEKMPARSVAAAIALAAALYLQDTLRIFLIAGAFNVWLTPAQAATMTVLRLIGGAAPVPGGVGVVEGSQIGGLVLFGIPAETAAAITIVERAILLVCGTAIGGVALALLGGRSVMAMSRSEQPD